MIPDCAAQSSAAVQRGLDFLERAITDDGAWPSRFYRNLALTGESVAERPPFIAALGILSLNLAEPRCAALRARSCAYLQRRAEAPGVWRYLDKLPPDADDTALCALALGGDPRRLQSPRQIELLLGCRNDDGLFCTWIVPDKLYQSDLPGVHDVDSVVNANVLAWLGARAETDAARNWIEGLIRDGRETDTSYHYPQPLDLHVAVARAACVRTPLFDSLLPILMQRLRDDLAAQHDDPARTAQALSALDDLGADLTAPELQCATERILRAQCDDGAWCETLLWRGPVPPAPPSLGYASSALNTAFCVEALHRFARHAGYRATPPAIRSTETESESFADLLRAIHPLFPPPLLADAHWQRVLALAQRLPSATAEQAFGFEFRLFDARAAGDLCIALAPNSQLAWHLIACGERAADDSPQASLAKILRAQCEQRESFYAESIASILLEYDLAQLEQVAPQDEVPFGIFLLPRAHHTLNTDNPRIEWRNDPDEARALHRALVEVAGWDDDADEQRAMLRVLDALARSDDGYLYHAGVMPARTPRAIRLVLKGMTAHEIADFLARMKWRGAIDDLHAILTLNESIDDAFAEVALSVDVIAHDDCIGNIGPRIGLELYQRLPWDACSRAIWQPLLDHLQRRDDCIARKVDALRSLPGTHLLYRRNRAYRARIGINHIKITFDGQRIEAKAYIGMLVREER